MAIYMWREYIPQELCFTANTAGSTVQLAKNGNPTAVTLETSTDGVNWSTYTFGNNITLSNVGDKVYFRNTSETTTAFSTSTGNYYNFTFGGSINASGDITSLVNKNCTTILANSSYTFCRLFYNSAGNTCLKTSPKLPATNLSGYCYYQMFYYCTGLTTLPELPATTLSTYCYVYMFRYCTNIKVSETQTGEYQIPYRIPTTGTGAVGSNSLNNMFSGTGGTFTGTPTINTTYYTSNQVI